MTFDLDRWQTRLGELCAEHHVPGASLAVLTGGEIHELATGVLHRGTGVAATTDSLFQVGSITKVHTATLIMQLVDEGALELDAPVLDVLPDFAVPDEQATKTITVRQLLSHTGGLTCDFTEDTGRGDDCLARYVDAAKNVPLDCPPGIAVSYSSVGYNVLGRIVEVLTGQTWDDALQDRLCVPLGLRHTVTLPEDVLRFRAAMGHLGMPGTDPDPAPSWNPLPRSSGPYGGVLCSTAADLVRLGRLHLDGGRAPDGTRLLSAESVAAMRRREVDTPDKWTFGSDAWGLGWALYDWEGGGGFGHDGAAIGQYGYLRAGPEAGVVIALLINGGDFGPLVATMLRELLGELAEVRLPPAFAPAENPPAVDITPYIGTYRREGVELTITDRAGAPHLSYEFVDGMAGMSPPLETDLEPVSGTVFAGRFGADWMPVVFRSLPDGKDYAYVGMRAAPKVG